MEVSITEIIEKPELLDTNRVIYIKDEKKEHLKSVVIPAKYYGLIKKEIEEIEYQTWLERNKDSLSQDLDGLFDEAIEEIGNKL